MFFFSNFSNGFGELDMIKVFQRWARVKEVFISRRLNKWGRRFGFVRFFYVRNVGRLERELDQIYIGNMKLFVNFRSTEDMSSNPIEMREGTRGPYTRRNQGTMGSCIWMILR